LQAQIGHGLPLLQCRKLLSQHFLVLFWKKGGRTKLFAPLSFRALLLPLCLSLFGALFFTPHQFDLTTLSHSLSPKEPCATPQQTPRLNSGPETDLKTETANNRLAVTVLPLN
jgi:hypothetical protein